MLPQIKLFHPGAITPSMQSEASWETVQESSIQGQNCFALTPLASGPSVPATPLWTDAQMAGLQHNQELRAVALIQQQQHQQDQQANVEQEQQLPNQLAPDISHQQWHVHDLGAAAMKKNAQDADEKLQRIVKQQQHQMQQLLQKLRHQQQQQLKQQSMHHYTVQKDYQLNMVALSE